MGSENEENLSLFPQCILESLMIRMMTSLVADKSVMIKNKIIMNFMNELINPPCNSSLATFFHQFMEYVPRQCHFPCGS